MLPEDLLSQARALGAQISRLRKARQLRQSDVALRAGISRPTAVRIEAGDPGRTLGQLLRYLDAIAPGSSLLDLLQAKDPALKALQAREETQRVHAPRKSRLDELDF